MKSSKILNHNHEDAPMPMGRYSESYVHLATNRLIFMNEVFTKNVAAELSSLMLYYDHTSEKENINLFIHSPGGDAAGLTQIYDVMQMIKAPVQTICLGKAYSAGAVLLAAGSKGKRFMMKNARVMIHGLQCGFPVPGDSIVESENYLKYLESYNHTVMKILADHTGHTVAKITEDCKKDVWLDAKQALEYNLVDHILEDFSQLFPE